MHPVLKGSRFKGNRLVANTQSWKNLLPLFSTLLCLLISHLFHYLRIECQGEINTLASSFFTSLRPDYISPQHSTVLSSSPCERKYLMSQEYGPISCGCMLPGNLEQLKFRELTWLQNEIPLLINLLTCFRRITTDTLRRQGLLRSVEQHYPS